MLSPASAPNRLPPLSHTAPWPRRVTGPAPARHGESAFSEGSTFSSQLLFIGPSAPAITIDTVASGPVLKANAHAPFTAFASWTNPFDGALAAAPRLDVTDNPFAVLYNDILANNAVDARGFKVLAKRGMGRDRVRFHGRTWAAPCSRARRPDELRKQNHERTQPFIRSLQLQYLAPSARATRAPTAHPAFLTFERRTGIKLKEKFISSMPQVLDVDPDGDDENSIDHTFHDFLQLPAPGDIPKITSPSSTLSTQAEEFWEYGPSNKVFVHLALAE
ncbi:hypothetical protein BJV74DRAFT_888196 [Russula compacta]|nr:hypothetical protein BJV74DRAFT_888196 [Russula compacta]